MILNSNQEAGIVDPTNLSRDCPESWVTACHEGNWANQTGYYVQAPQRPPRHVGLSDARMLCETCCDVAAGWPEAQMGREGISLLSRPGTDQRLSQLRLGEKRCWGSPSAGGRQGRIRVPSAASPLWLRPDPQAQGNLTLHPTQFHVMSHHPLPFLATFLSWSQISLPASLKLKLVEKRKTKKFFVLSVIPRQIII